MPRLSQTIKIALENSVLCRGTHGARESYEYAERMEGVIKTHMVVELEAAGNDPEKLTKIIKDLKGE
jgi:hypothetical protein